MVHETISLCKHFAIDHFNFNNFMFLRWNFHFFLLRTSPNPKYFLNEINILSQITNLKPCPSIWNHSNIYT